ncbi:hypothetical protein EC957_002440 [Mortierella hygrophila]|uniref:Kazal-like domain-containing protein n=1 Tax=Mortierella hygrophila TaxID=979708 RepID=A0A9P6K7Q3_9FUNG|nr:hypothetical protein EC957_002440 [Mortierella hygrophila]
MLNPLPALLSMILFLGILSNALPTPISGVPGTSTTTTMVKLNYTSITITTTNTTRAITTTTAKATTTPYNTRTLSYPDSSACTLILPELPSPITPTKPVSTTTAKIKPTSTTWPRLSFLTALPNEKTITGGEGYPGKELIVGDPATKQKAMDALRAKVAECEKECLVTDPDVCLKGFNGRNYRMNSCRLRVMPCSRPNVTYEIIDISECPDREPQGVEE